MPTMLQIKALPLAPETPEPSREKRNAVPYRAAVITGVAGVVFAFLWLALWVSEKFLLHPEDYFYSFFGILPLLHVFSRGLTFAFACTAVVLAIRDWVKSPLTEDTTQRRTFFVLGVVLLFPAFILASYLYEWQPHPRHTMLKRTQFSYGSFQRLLPQDSTPIPMDERQILWMTDERIDRMMPMELYFYFRTLEQPMFSHNFQENYEAVKDTYRIWVTGTAILLILAFAGIIVSFFMPRQEVVVTGWSGSDW